MCCVDIPPRVLSLSIPNPGTGVGREWSPHENPFNELEKLGQ